VKTSPKRSYSVIENERSWLVFAKTGSINSGTESLLNNYTHLLCTPNAVAQATGFLKFLSLELYPSLSQEKVEQLKHAINGVAKTTGFFYSTI
jgi:hypothetical protein